MPASAPEKMTRRPHDGVVAEKGREEHAGSELIPEAGVPRFLGDAGAGGASAPADHPDGDNTVPRFLGRVRGRHQDAGLPLDEAARSYFESRLAADLSRVRIHADQQTDRLVRGVGAHAFTAGSHIYFRAGGYQPASASGHGLLAHEIVHTVQQAGLTTDAPLAALPLGERGAPAEREAQRVAGAVLGHRPTARAARPAPTAPRRRQTAAAGAALVPDVEGRGHRHAEDRLIEQRESAPVIRRDDGTPAPAPGTTPAQAPPPGAGPTPAAPLPPGATTTLDQIRQTLDTWWVGPFDEYDLERLWNSFGDDLPRVANANWDLFTQSVARGAELEDISAVRRVKDRFKEDVKATAAGHIRSNRARVVQQLEDMGVTAGGAGSEVTTTVRPMTEEQRARVEEVRTTAARVAQAQATRQLLETIPVGYDLDPEARPGLISLGAGVSPEEHARDVVARRGRRVLSPTTFSPFRRPHHPPFGDESPPMMGDAAVREHYDALSAIIAGFANANPAIYALVREGKVGDLANLTPEQTQGSVADSLRNVLVKMDQAAEMISSDDLDYRDLLPVHDQVRAGVGASGLNWTGNLEGWAVDRELEGHRAREFWISLGLGSLAAAAFIVAELATAGTATFFIAAGIGLGAGALQVGRQWEQYNDLATASGASVNDETRLVLEGQASAAHIAAIIESALLFLAVAGVAARGIGALRAVGGPRGLPPGEGGAAGAGEAGEAAAGGAARMLRLAQSKIARRLEVFKNRLLGAVNRTRPWSEEPLAARSDAIREIDELRRAALAEADRVRAGTASALSQESQSLSAAERATLADNYVSEIRRWHEGATNLIEKRFADNALVTPEGAGYGPRPPGGPPVRRPPSGHYGSGWGGEW